MEPYEDFVQSKEYWLETIQNDLYAKVYKYMEREGINQTQLAERLGVSKGYISQVLNGNFNHSLERLITLSLAVGVVPCIEFKKTEDYIQEQLVIREAIRQTHKRNDIKIAKLNKRLNR